ncbi:MAG: hypothetical protein WBD55_07775, partial [Dehalococcoidia bacterium]
EQADVLPIEAWNIAGQGGNVVGMAGEAPAALQRLDTDDSQPSVLTEFGPTIPGDEMTVGLAGDVWYRSRSIPGLARVDKGGSVLSFPLPRHKGAFDNRFGGHCISVDGETDGCTEQTIELDTPVLSIAAAPDGTAWFSTGDRIGHAIP